MNNKIINISLSPELLSQADKVAKEEYRSRSELIREAVRAYVIQRDLAKLRELQRHFREQARKKGITPKDVDNAIAQYRAENRKNSHRHEHSHTVLTD